MQVVYRFLNLRRGELALTLMLAALYYVVLSTHYFLKPARDSLFLARTGPAALPLVFILSAIVSAPITSFYSRVSRSLSLDRLVLVTFGFLALNLVGLRFLITASADWVYYVFYIWVGLFGAITTSQFWLLANALFDSSQAKRVFAILGTGGILGAVTGGELTGILVGRFGVATEDLVWVSAGALLLCMAMVVAVWRMTARQRTAETRRTRRPVSSERDGARGTREMFAMVLGTRHLGLTVGIVAATVTVGTLVDYQFKTISYATFSDTSALTSFLGTFYSRASLIALAVQMFLAGRLLGLFGAVGGLFALPATLGFSTAGLMAFPGLAAVVALRGGEMVLKYSLDKTSRELLFLPLSSSVKRDVKIWIDLFIDRAARGVAGLFLLALTLVFDASIRGVALATALLIAGWLVLVVQMRTSYREAFRRAISGREVEFVGSVHGADESVVASLLESLRSPSSPRVLYALRLLQDVPGLDLAEPLTSLLTHADSAVRRESLRVLRARNHLFSDETLTTLATDPDADVRREAVWMALTRDRRGLGVALADALDADDPHRTAAVLDALAREGSDEDLEHLDEERIGQLVETRATSGVTHATMRLVARRRLPTYVPWLVSRLASREDRATARECLIGYGPEVLESLVDALRSSTSRSTVRRAIPRIVSGIDDARSAEVLLDELREGDRDLRPLLVNALYHFHRAFPRYAIPRDAVLEVLEDEARTWFAVSQASAALGDSKPSVAMLSRALSEKRDEAFVLVFRLLGTVVSGGGYAARS